MQEINALSTKIGFRGKQIIPIVCYDVHEQDR